MVLPTMNDDKSESFVGAETPSVRDDTDRHDPDSMTNTSRCSIRNNKDREKLNLGLSTNISAIWNVNASDSTFDCDMLLNLSYFDPVLKELAAKDPETFHKGKFLDPEDPELGSFQSRPVPKMLNDVDVEVTPSSYYILDPLLGLVNYSYRYKGTFREVQEVDSFPFDEQEVRVRFRFSDIYRLMNHHFEKSHWFGYAQSTEFTFAKKLKDGTPEIEEDFYYFRSIGSGRKYPLYAITVTLQRRWMYYIWNLFLFIFLLVLLGCCVFLAEASQDAVIDREGLVLGIFLTFAAFKFVIAEKIPQVSYLTSLDKYLLLALFLSTFSGVETMIACALEHEDLDFYSMIAYWVVFIIGHFYIAFDSMWANTRIRKKRIQESAARLGLSQFKIEELEEAKELEALEMEEKSTTKAMSPI